MISPGSLEWCYLGRRSYADALALQFRLREAIRSGRRGDVMLLLEHPPVITLGRSADSSHVLISEPERERQSIGLFRVQRGGDVTVHAPGQLVGYPLRRLRSRAVRAHVVALIEGLRGYLAGELAIEATWEDANPGLWTSTGKIAAVGVDARGGVAMHGFALNLDVDLDAFSMIVPCGQRRPVTSVAALSGSSPGPAAAAATVAQYIGRALGGVELRQIEGEQLEGELITWGVS